MVATGSPRRPTDRPSQGARRTDTRDPHRSRERALKVLFQADVRDADVLDTLRGIIADPRARALLDDLDLSAPEEDALEREEQAKADAEAGTTLGADRAAEPLDQFSRTLVEGVHDHRAEIDDLIQRFARKWSISRMPVVDRNVLRLATYELLYQETAPAVVIDEALELAKALSTDNSGRYVNGVLESVRRSIEKRRADASDG